MTLEERAVLAVVTVIGQEQYDALSNDDRATKVGWAYLYIKAGFPELFSVPPTGWIAPWVPDEGMLEQTRDNWADFEAIPVFTSMRDDWLSRHPMKPTEAK